ncbi:MAG: hypothetical protein LBR80_19105 [Deltaproteobacteria bacterium]|nr:hypothetical protein [Deltaproteobacteria bacterium]
MAADFPATGLAAAGFLEACFLTTRCLFAGSSEAVLLATWAEAVLLAEAALPDGFFGAAKRHVPLKITKATAPVAAIAMKQGKAIGSPLVLLWFSFGFLFFSLEFIDARESAEIRAARNTGGDGRAARRRRPNRSPFLAANLSGTGVRGGRRVRLA